MMKLKCLFVVGVLNLACLVAPLRADLVALYEFQNPGNLGQATIGNDLILNNANGTIVSRSGMSAFAGDLAAEVGVGDSFSLNHGLAPNGGSTEYVNEYTVVFDLFLPSSSFSSWRTLLQTSAGPGTNDGDYFFRNSDSAIGVGAIGYVDAGVQADNWYRIVFSADVGSTIAGGTGSFLTTVIDENGNRATYDHALQGLDGRHSLYSTVNDNIVHFFADNDGDDALLYVTQLGMFDTALTGNDLLALGGPGTSLNAIPEPTTPLVLLGLSAIIGFARRRR